MRNKGNVYDYVGFGRTVEQAAKELEGATVAMGLQRLDYRPTRVTVDGQVVFIASLSSPYVFVIKHRGKERLVFKDKEQVDVREYYEYAAKARYTVEQAEALLDLWSRGGSVSVVVYMQPISKLLKP